MGQIKLHNPNNLPKSEWKKLVARLKQIKIERKTAHDKDTHEGYMEYTDLKWEERKIKQKLGL